MEDKLEEKIELEKSIVEINNMLKYYDRNRAIELIKKVRRNHPGKEQITYVLFNTPLEYCTDDVIVNNLTL